MSSTVVRQRAIRKLFFWAVRSCSKNIPESRVLESSCSCRLVVQVPLSTDCKRQGRGGRKCEEVLARSESANKHKSTLKQPLSKTPPPPRHEYPWMPPWKPLWMTLWMIPECCCTECGEGILSVGWSRPLFVTDKPVTDVLTLQLSSRKRSRWIRMGYQLGAGRGNTEDDHQSWFEL